MKFRVNKCAKIWKKNAEKNLSGKKSNFNFQNRGYFRKKIIRKSFETSVIISLKNEKFPILGVLCKTFFIGKKSNFNFQNRGYFRKKIIRKSFETSVIISLKKEKFPILGVLCKTFFIGKYSNFNFQNRGYFVKKNVPQIS